MTGEINSIVGFKQNSYLRNVIYVFEALFFLILYKSFGFSVIYILLLFSIFFLYFYPELGLAVAATGSILIMIILDAITVYIPVPILSYFFILVFGGFVVHLLKSSDSFYVKLSQPQIISFLILLLMVAGLFYSSDRSYGSKKVIFYLIFNISLVVLPLIFANDIKRLGNILVFIYFLGLILALVSSIIAIHSPSYVRLHASENVNPIWLARSLGISVLFSLYVLTLLKSRFLKCAIVATYPLFLYPMLRSWSRAPLVALMVCIVIFFFLQPKFGKKKKIFFGAIFTTLFIVLLLFTSNQIAARLHTPISEEWSAAFRLLAWFKAGRLFLQSPVLGIGTGSFIIDLPFAPFHYPHNLFLEMACENGFAGLLLVILFIFFTLKIGLQNIKLSKDTKYNQMAIVFVTGFFFALMNAMFSGEISSNETMWLFTGMMVAFNNYFIVKET